MCTRYVRERTQCPHHSGCPYFRGVHKVHGVLCMLSCQQCKPIMVHIAGRWALHLHLRLFTHTATAYSYLYEQDENRIYSCPPNQYINSKIYSICAWWSCFALGGAVKTQLRQFIRWGELIGRKRVKRTKSSTWTYSNQMHVDYYMFKKVITLRKVTTLKKEDR